MNQKVPLLIKYEGPATDAGIDFSVVGTSFIGFDQLLKDVFLISKVNGTLEVKTEKVEHGSIDAFIHLYISLNGLPFDNPKYLFEFLQIAAPEFLTQAKELFSLARSIDDGFNEFFRERPFDTLLIQSYFIYLFRKHGKKMFREDPRIPDRVYKRMANMYKWGRFKKALSPLKENGYEKITISQAENIDITPTEISDSDLKDYLPDEEQVLPFLQNGDNITFQAKVVGLSSTHGETVTLRAVDLDKKANLYRAYPQSGYESSAYKELYGQDVTIQAVVVRKNNNLFKKPEFKIISMEQLQMMLELG